MKKYFTIALLLGLLAVFATPLAVYANRPRHIGDMGFHGGISEGRHLPRTLETIILQQGGRSRGNRNNAITLEYRELIFLGGRPVLFEGTKEIRAGQPGADTAAGTFRVEHRVRASDATAEGVSINRTQIFNVEYRREGGQMIYHYVIDRNTWRDVITTPAGTFTLDFRRSSFNVSTIEDQQPGVSYYRGHVSARLFYTGGPNGTITVEKMGEFYGLTTAWSATETHIMNVNIVNDAGDWALQYQIRPSVTVNKVLQWSDNVPMIISFEGNFRELHQSFAGWGYNIFIRPLAMWDEPLFGFHNMETFNVFEQLPVADLSFLRGHPAEDDIQRLFSMQVLTGDPRHYVPEQAITRGQFLTALARAIKLPVAEPGRDIVTLYSDVTSARPEFRYIQAIRQAGIAFGRDDGRFYFDYALSRQEAVTTIIRALGLTNLALNPTVVTPFVDSDRIEDWAMREVSVALMLGLIAPDANGNFHPTNAISKAEAATLLNNLIDFMREGIVGEYSEQLVHITW